MFSMPRRHPGVRRRDRPAAHLRRLHGERSWPDAGSVEGVQLELQAAVGLLLEHVGGDAAEGRRRPARVLALAPTIWPRRRSARRRRRPSTSISSSLWPVTPSANRPAKNFSTPAGPSITSWRRRQEDGVLGVEGGDRLGVAGVEGRVPGLVGGRRPRPAARRRSAPADAAMVPRPATMASTANTERLHIRLPDISFQPNLISDAAQLHRKADRIR